MLKSTIALVLVSGAAIIAAAGVAKAQSAPENLLVGDTKVETLSSYKGPTPLPKPDKVLVYDFAVPSGIVTMDESMAAQIQRRHMPLRGADNEASPEDVAHRVQTSFSKELVSELTRHRYLRTRLQDQIAWCPCIRSPFRESLPP